MRILDSNQTPKTPKIQQQNLQILNFSQEIVPTNITKNLASFSAASLTPEIPFLQTRLILDAYPTRANPIIPRTANLFESLFCMTKQPKDSASLDIEILQNLTKYSHLYRKTLQSSKESHSNLYNILWQPHTKLLDKVNEKLKQINKISSQDIKESKEFLKTKMDSILLQFYKENLTLQQILSTKAAHEKFAKQPLSDETAHTLLLEYGAQAELESLENALINFLSTLPYLLKDAINSKEMDSSILQDIQAQINLYRERKIEAIGYKFFAQVADTLHQDEQEKIANAIAQILMFYTQPNTLEAGGYKISWTPHSFNAKEYHTTYGIQTALSSIAHSDISIAFQVLMVLPTHLKQTF